MSKHQNNEENGTEKESKDWFHITQPGAKADFPEILNPKVCKVYHLTFKEKKPRIVPDKFGKTAVIEVEYNGELRSLFLGHRYLAQKIYAIQKRRGSLMDIRISLHRLKKIKDYIEYDVRKI
jgi:hypothetical protein